TTDLLGNTVCNSLVGILNGAPSKAILISSEVLKSTKAKYIKEAMINGLKKLWPNGISYEAVCLVLTDAAPNMKKAMELAKSEFTNLKHVTCLAHAMNRVCERIRTNNFLADSFISKMKKLLTNSPKRKRIFRV